MADDDINSIVLVGPRQPVPVLMITLFWKHDADGACVLTCNHDADSSSSVYEVLN